jgi:hypothetical protein
MLRMSGQPAIGQQGFQGSRIAWGDGRNPTQHIGQVRPHVNAVPPGTLHQRVECRGRLSTMLASEKQVVLATDGDGPQKPLNHVVVYLYPAVLSIPDEGVPAVQHVVDRLGQFCRRTQRGPHPIETGFHLRQDRQRFRLA